MKTKQLGRWAEVIAAHLLIAKGFKILARNFNTRFGEIDIVCLDNRDNSVVFIEVRYRGKGSYLLPEETITSKKQRSIRLTASIYLNKFGIADSPVRFDLVCVSKDKWFMPARVQHIADAF